MHSISHGARDVPGTFGGLPRAPHTLPVALKQGLPQPTSHGEADGEVRKPSVYAPSANRGSTEVRATGHQSLEPLPDTVLVMMGTKDLLSISQEP